MHTHVNLFVCFSNNIVPKHVIVSFAERRYQALCAYIALPFPILNTYWIISMLTRRIINNQHELKDKDDLGICAVTLYAYEADDEDKMVKKADIYLTNHDPTFSRRHAKITVVKKENSYLLKW